MITLNELSGKKAALGAGTAAAMAGGGLGAAELLKRKREKEATAVSAAQSHEDRKLAGKTGPTGSEEKDIMSRKGGVTAAQKETFADKQAMVKDERPLVNRGIANLRRKLGGDTEQLRKDIAKVPGEAVQAAKDAAASPSGQAAKEMLKTSGRYLAKKGKEHFSADSPTMAGIKGVMKTAGDFWKKKLQDDVDLTLATGLYKASKR